MSPTPATLILASTARELQSLAPEVESMISTNLESISFSGKIGGHHILGAEIGVGKSNAAMAAADLFRRFEIRLAILFGCAGAYRQSGLRIGDVVLANEEIFADEGVLAPEGFLELARLGLPLASLPNGAPVYNRIPVMVPAGALDRPRVATSFQIHLGAIATVSTCSGTDEQALEIHRRWKPLAEAMEGAAVALAALKYRRPFLEVRGISNFAGKRERESWNLPLACANAAEVVANLLRKEISP